jgi:hypothetical protein
MARNDAETRSVRVRVGFRAVFKCPPPARGAQRPTRGDLVDTIRMSSTTPRRAFVTLVRDALASANASRLARPLHAKVKVQPPHEDAPAPPSYRFAEPTRSADAPAPLASWRGASASWLEGGRARGASKLPSFRFPEALSATDTNERGAYASDVKSASSRAAFSRLRRARPCARTQPQDATPSSRTRSGRSSTRERCVRSTRPCVSTSL